MATGQLGDFNTGFSNPLDIVTGATGSNNRSWSAAWSAMEDSMALDSSLTAYDAFTYSAANLQLMSPNDKLFAFRSCRMPLSISDYSTAQGVRSS